MSALSIITTLTKMAILIAPRSIKFIHGPIYSVGTVFTVIKIVPTVERSLGSSLLCLIIKLHIYGEEEIKANIILHDEPRVHGQKQTGAIYCNYPRSA